MASTRLSNTDVRICYELSGAADAPVVCLNHCFGADHRYWDFHLDALGGFRVLRFDMRGHGASDKPPGPYTLSALAGDVARLCDELAIDAVHYCGVSLGGQVAQTFALEHADRLRSLVLVNTTCEYTQEQVAQWRERARIVMEQGIEAISGPLLERWLTQEAASQNTAPYQYMAEVIRNFEAGSFAAASEAMCMLETAQHLHTITVPSLVIAAPDDPGAPREVSEKMAARIPDCELQWLEPARHLSSLEHPQRFNEMLRRFLLAQVS